MHRDKILEFCRIGFNINGEWRIRIRDVELLKDIIRLSRPYNSYEPKKLIKAVEKIADLLGMENANYEIGNVQGMITFIVHIPYWKDKDQRFGNEERREIVEKILEYLKEADPDEAVALKYTSTSRGIFITSTKKYQQASFVEAYWD